MRGRWQFQIRLAFIGVTAWGVASVAFAQLDLPRHLPAVNAYRESPQPLPRAIVVQHVEPMPETLYVNSAVEMVDAPPPQMGPPQGPVVGPSMDPAFSSPVGPDMVFEGTPDVFPQADSIGGEMHVAQLPCGNCGSCEACQTCQDCFTWQILPAGIIYHSYLAGPKEPRMSAVFWHDSKLGWQLDYTVGSRVGLVRYGNTDDIWPQGWQLDLEGAAFPRVNLDENMDLDAADYRVGIPLTYGRDKWQAKVAVYHLSAHVGDEYLIRNPSFERVNYVRDALVGGFSWYPFDMLRLYGETEWAFNRDGGAKPWAFQFGFELSPLRDNGCGGDPFLAVNTSLREDVDFGGNFCLQVGWQWRGQNSRRLMRTGLHYLAGKSNQFEFYRQHEDQLGVGVWYDF